jgi:Ca-activated chloride channel homolog
MTNINFLNPEFFWLLLLIPLLVFWYFKKRNTQSATLKISSISGFKTKPSKWTLLKPALYIVRILSLIFLIISLARPRSVDTSNKSQSTRGIDIVIATDVSGSMLARDLKPSRLEALKKVASDFVEERTNDRIGIVVYAAESYTKTPVTSDKSIVLEAIKSIQYDTVLQDGTGIGMGLATAVNRLKESKAKSKVIILMTDGVNNAGFLDPITAAEIAAEFKIKVYTIGIGTNGMAELPYMQDPNGTILYKMAQVEIDEQLMMNIAKKTGGKYFRAQNNSSLENIYKEINKLETTEISELKYVNYDEKFRVFALISLLLLLIEITLRNTIFKSFI